jgi:hypothetical protein
LQKALFRIIQQPLVPSSRFIPPHGMQPHMHITTRFVLQKPIHGGDMSVLLWFAAGHTLIDLPKRLIKRHICCL